MFIYLENTLQKVIWKAKKDQSILLRNQINHNDWFFSAFLPIKYHLQSHLNFVIIVGHSMILGCSQAVRQRTLTPSCIGSNPITPANKKKNRKVPIALSCFCFFLYLTTIQITTKKFPNRGILFQWRPRQDSNL